MATVALIPAYEPDSKLFDLVKELKSYYFDILIVDDGSGPDYKDIFDSCREYADVIGYENNQGKGYALKLGMQHILDNYPECTCFLTADADGQHSVRDICRIRDELVSGNDFVLSIRGLRKEAPLRSRLGNGLSKFMFTIANARYLPDNQSGLRGFDIKHIDWMLKVEGNKYDYELNIIIFAEKQGIKITKIPIETIYFDNNSNSHFKAIPDTVRIYKTYFRTNIFALISLAIEIVIVILATIFLSPGSIPFVVMVNWGIHTLLCMVIERYTKFRWIKYTPGARRLIISIFKYFLYWMICWGLSAISIPFAPAYIFAMIIIVIGEYYLLKVAYD